MLLDQCLEPVGELARQCRQHASGLDQRGLEGSGDLGQQFLARRQVGERVDVGCGQRNAAQHPTFDHQRRIGLGRLAQRLGSAGDVARDKRQGCWTDQDRIKSVETRLLDGDLGQRVLVDHVLGANRTQRIAHSGQLLDTQSAVLRHENCLRFAQLRGDLGNRGDLGGAGLAARLHRVCCGITHSVHTSFRFDSWLAVRAPRGARRNRSIREACTSVGGEPITRRNGPTVFGEQTNM